MTKDFTVTIEDDRAEQLADDHGSVGAAVYKALDVIEWFDDPEEVDEIVQAAREGGEP